MSIPTPARLVLLAAAIGGLLAPARAAAEPPAVVFDASAGGAAVPRGEGVTSALADVGGRQAAELTVAGGVAWARVFFQKSVPADIRAFARLELDLRSAGAQVDIQLRLADAAQRSAGLKIAAPKKDWETRSVVLADFAPEAGFDPEHVTSLSLLWQRPTGTSVGLARVAFVPGEGGWRYGPEDQAKHVFGDKLAKQVKHESSAHFEVFSDSPKALKDLGPLLEADVQRIAGLFWADKESLKAYHLPVYAFKSAGDYSDYCVKNFGWTEEQAQRRPATGTSWALILHFRDGPMPDRTHRLARSLFQHLFGPGGGAWLQDGAGEYCVRQLDKRPVTKELLPRLKTGDLWPLADLLRAEPLYSPTANTQASYDYRPIYLQAGSVFEYLLRQAPASAAGDTGTPFERITARFKTLGAVRSTGKERVPALEQALGMPLPAFEAAWKAWANAGGT